MKSMGRIPLTGLDRLNYCSRRLTRRAKGGSQRQWGCARLRTGLRKAITHKESPLSRDAFLGRCIRAGILYLAFAIYQMPGAAAHAAPFAYVANAGSDDVSVIDIATNTVLTTVTVGVSPEQVAVSPKGLFAYVTNPGSDNVSVIATASNTVVATILVGTGPAGIAATPNGAVYVANSGSNNVSVIDTATNTVVATIVVDSGPAGVAITPNGAVYVANFVANNVSVIDTATNTVIATILVGQRPDFLAVSLNGASVFVPNQDPTNQNPSTVSVIATASNTVTATISVGVNPTGVATTPPNTPSIPTLSNGAFLFLLAAMAAALALRIVTRQASPPPRPPRAI